MCFNPLISTRLFLQMANFYFWFPRITQIKSTTCIFLSVESAQSIFSGVRSMQHAMTGFEERGFRYILEAPWRASMDEAVRYVAWLWFVCVSSIYTVKINTKGRWSGHGHHWGEAALYVFEVHGNRSLEEGNGCLAMYARKVYTLHSTRSVASVWNQQSQSNIQRDAEEDHRLHDAGATSWLDCVASLQTADTFPGRFRWDACLGEWWWSSSSKNLRNSCWRSHSIWKNWAAAHWGHLYFCDNQNDKLKCIRVNDFM